MIKPPWFVVAVRKHYRHAPRDVVYRTRAAAVRAALREQRIWGKPDAIIYDVAAGRFVRVDAT